MHHVKMLWQATYYGQENWQLITSENLFLFGFHLQLKNKYYLLFLKTLIKVLKFLLFPKIATVSNIASLRSFMIPFKTENIFQSWDGIILCVQRQTTSQHLLQYQIINIWLFSAIQRSLLHNDWLLWEETENCSVLGITKEWMNSFFFHDNVFLYDWWL